MENGSEDGFLEFPSAMTSSGDEEILEVEFEEEEDMEEFEMAKFEELMYKLKNRKEVSHWRFRSASKSHLEDSR